MKNANYNLVKLLLAKLDDTWRVETHYSTDAEKHGCTHCSAVLKNILADDAKHVELLRQELSRHIKDGAFE